jgi:exopolysaccharide biosynthesis protein
MASGQSRRSRPWLLGCYSWLALLAAAGCELPDRALVSVQDLPAGLVAYVEPSRASTLRLAEGVFYHSVGSATEPWSLHLLEVDPTRCEVGFRVAITGTGEVPVTVSELAGAPESGVVAAVNGDFFTADNRPIGVEASAGEVRGRSTRTVFAWQPRRLPSVGRVEWDGDSLSVGDFALSATEPDGLTEIISGYPALLADGEWVGDLLQAERPAFAASRHPRTALGWDPHRRRAWIVVAEGRGEGSAEGMTLPELADLFLALGATEALNLDGGGSSVMVVQGRRVNRPSDPMGSRPVVNALLVRVDSSYCQ